MTIEVVGRGERAAEFGLVELRGIEPRTSAVRLQFFGFGAVWRDLMEVGKSLKNSMF
ncbi:MULTISPECIES: hypothetical protein [unclassified Methylosinus]|uniref:hypothetical protein n=1 Tax=unclassified Methylosinus TaxID=2624500 RepID=UPI0012ECCCE2|nr:MULTISPECIES: hypothetical protein [unclassified Methylosinus]